VNFALLDPRRLATVVDNQAKARLHAMERGARSARQDQMGQQVFGDIIEGRSGAAADRIVERTPSYQRQLAEMPMEAAGERRKEMQRGVTRGLTSVGDMGDQAVTAQVAQGYAQAMNRGPGGLGRRGVLEGAAHMANNPMVRRGGLAAAGAGATVASGALMTAGAQQLLTLIDYLNHGQQVQQQVEQSPLLT